MNSARRKTKATRAATPAGFSLIEVLISTLLTALVLVGAMRCLGQTLQARSQTSDTARAWHLAHQLMSEIVVLEYADEATPPLFGPEAGEATGHRALFDDVDDFHQWSASPPQNADGSALTHLSGWERSVSVEYVDPADPARTVVADQGVKRITITVRKGGVVLARLITIRTRTYVQR